MGWKDAHWSQQRVCFVSVFSFFCCFVSVLSAHGWPVACAVEPLDQSRFVFCALCFACVVVCQPPYAVEKNHIGYNKYRRWHSFFFRISVTRKQFLVTSAKQISKSWINSMKWSMQGCDMIYGGSARQAISKAAPTIFVGSFVLGIWSIFVLSLIYWRHGFQICIY